MTLIQSLSDTFPGTQLKYNEPMKNHTTFHVGGPADIALFPIAPDGLLQALRLAKSYSVPALIVGNGSNLIVRDGGIRGLTIFTAGINEIEIEGNILRAQAGAMLSQISNEAMKSGLSGLEFAAGIPGSVGGATAMNAGAYGESISDVLTRCCAYMDEKLEWQSSHQLEMGYRSTRILKSNGVVLISEFELSPDSPPSIRKKMDLLNAQRRDKQPLDKPSAGSTFKRPEGHFAGKLIEDAGLKGLSIGGAQVSEKHAGFIINAGLASATDILSLISLVQEKVFRHSGVRLECEVRVVGED